MFKLWGYFDKDLISNVCILYAAERQELFTSY